MVAVSLDRVYVHLADDLSQYVAVNALVSEVPSVQGSVRQRAGGNFQAVTRTGRGTTLAVDISLANRTQIDTLRSWTGQRVMIRDPRGRKHWGLFFSADIPEIPAVDRADVRLTLSAVTHSEAV